MTETLAVRKNILITQDQADWIDIQSRQFNFSQLVRDAIDAEIAKSEV